MFEIGVLGFGGENEVVEEVFGFRNKVYLLSRCYFIILNIKFIKIGRASCRERVCYAV